MVRKTYLVLTLLPALALGEARDITDCTIPGGHTYSASTPFQLDWCTLVNDDDITQLLIDIADEQGASVYIAAPSSAKTLVSDYIAWATAPTVPVTHFEFLEDATATLLIQQDPTPTQTYILWRFDNFDTVKIGGTGLRMTFNGNHPGLGIGAVNTNDGLLHFNVDANVTPALLDLRANIRNANAGGYWITGSVHSQTLGGTRDRIEQVNIAGTFWNAPGGANGAVQSMWIDPATVFSDPFNRYYGWDGAVNTTINGRAVGCHDNARAQLPYGSGAGSPYAVDHLTGGFTAEYGYMSWVARNTGSIGNSAADPFVIKIKDWGASGPEAETGYPSGVMVHKTAEANFLKGDPHNALGYTAPFRFVRIEMLEPDYGNGFYGANLVEANCAPGNASDNGDTGFSNFLRLEANNGGQETQTINVGWDVQLVGDFTTNFVRGTNQLLYLAFDPFTSSGDTVVDRSYGHVIRIPSGTTINDDMTIVDTNTLTGSGTWTNITVDRIVSRTAGVYAPCADNVIRDTHIAGKVTVNGECSDTTLDKVFFTGTARNVLEVEVGANVTITGICAAVNSTITGGGDVTMDGTALTLPFTFSSANACPSAPTIN
jgi:hypothetical protein